MNEETFQQARAEKWAYGLMGGFLFLMFIVAFAVWIDGQNRSNVEKVTTPTAVADPIMIDFDPRDNPGREVLRWREQPYFLQTNEPVNVPEFEAFKVGRDDKGKIELYQIAKQNDLRVVLVKIRPNEFLRLTPR
jgi:hypothetical protein